MNHKNYKIGFSNIGGIYVGKDIQSDFHKHYAITVLLTFGEPFKITPANDQTDSYQAAIIQKNIGYILETGEKDYVAFIHIVPYSEVGMNLIFNAFQSVPKKNQNTNTNQKILHTLASIPFSFYIYAIKTYIKYLQKL